MKKKLVLFLCLAFIFTMFSGYAMNTKKNNQKKTVESYVLVHNWGNSKDRNNPNKVEEILNLIGDVDFIKLYPLDYDIDHKLTEAFLNYPNHNAKTIENIFKAREKTYGRLSNEFDKTIFGLYNKTDVKPIIDKVTKSNPKYKKLFDSIVKSETNVKLVYSWWKESNRSDPNQVKKILDIIGDIDFTKLSDLQTSSGDKDPVEFYYYFYNYPYHNTKTIENIFRASFKTDGCLSEEMHGLIYDLYKKNNTKPIVKKVINSNSSYKDLFKTIVEFETQ